MTFITKLLRDKENPYLQFIKYGCCGGAAVAVDTLTFYLVAFFVFYSLTPDDYVVRLLGVEVEPMSETVQGRNFAIGKVVAFMASNTVAYILNVLFVFKGGKHARHKEMVMFFALSSIAFFLGLLSGWILIRFFGIQTTVSNLTAVVFAVLINYAGRKFLIFKG